jgi:hypothetical protein
MIVTVEKRNTRRENLSQCHFVHQKSHMERLGLKPSLCGKGPANDRRNLWSAHDPNFSHLK